MDQQSSIDKMQLKNIYELAQPKQEPNDEKVYLGYRNSELTAYKGNKLLEQEKKILRD